MAVVVVESPAKAKTINKYLGDDFTVLASYGHVRDLPAKDGSVDPEHGFDMTWEVAADSRKHVRAIAEALKSDDTLILATDPDREGEAISWHLQEALASSLKKGKTVRRVTFNAITKSAVTEAMAHPRDVDMELVEAYLARRALDYLVGFNLSPVLWRKLPGARSAGRVQSVCLRLIVERELEIEAFRAREYWTVEAVLATPAGIHRAPDRSGREETGQVRYSEHDGGGNRGSGCHFPNIGGEIGRGEASGAQPLAAVHDIDAPAGGQPQVRHGRQGLHVGGAAAL
jgi:DNA topoisomerase-1